MSKIFEGATHNPLALEQVLRSLLTDLTSLKTAGDTENTAVDELIADHATFKAVVDDIKTLVNDIRAKVLGDYLDTATGMGIGSTPQNVANTAFEFHVNGKEYTKAAVAAGTALSGDDLPTAKTGAWALDIGVNGTVDITPATDNATGYASSVLALAAIPAVATDHVRMGTVAVANATGTDFVPGTTALDAANITDTYADGTAGLQVGSAVATSSPATLSASAPTAIGTLETT